MLFSLLKTARSFKHSVLALLFGLAVHAIPSPTQAQEVDEEVIAEARANFQRAIELEHVGNWSEAMKLFRKVGTVKMTPQVRYHIASCEENLGHLVVALGGYELALAQAEGLDGQWLLKTLPVLSQMVS